MARFTPPDIRRHSSAGPRNVARSGRYPHHRPWFATPSLLDINCSTKAVDGSASPSDEPHHGRTVEKVFDQHRQNLVIACKTEARFGFPSMHLLKCHAQPSAFSCDMPRMTQRMRTRCPTCIDRRRFLSAGQFVACHRRLPFRLLWLSVTVLFERAHDSSSPQAPRPGPAALTSGLASSSPG